MKFKYRHQERSILKSEEKSFQSYFLQALSFHFAQYDKNILRKSRKDVALLRLYKGFGQRILKERSMSNRQTS
jgi:hypothetical protein